MPPPCAYKFSSGLNQKFPSKLHIINTQDLKPYLSDPEKDIFSLKDDFCPIIIQIETLFPENYKGKSRKNCQFTYGCFDRESNSQIMRYKYMKQKLLYNN